MKSWRDKFIEYGVYVTIFLTPILYLGNGWMFPHLSPKAFFFQGATDIIFAFWVFTVIFDTSYRLSKKTLLFFAPLVAYLVWMTIAGIFGIHPELSFWSSLERETGLINLYHIFAFALVVASLIRRNSLSQFGNKFLLWFISSGFVLSLSVWLGNEGFDLPIRVLSESKGGGLIGNSSLTASFLIFVIFFCVFLLVSKQVSRKSKIWTWIVLVTTISSPLFLNFFDLFSGDGIIISARGATLGILVGAVALVVGHTALSPKKSVKKIGFTIVIFCFALSLFGWNRLVTPDATLHQKFAEVATPSRFIFWDVAKEAIADKPIMGFGPENYMIVYQKYFNPDIFLLGTSVEVWNDRAHNMFYETGVAGGYPAIFFYVVFFLSLFYATYRLVMSGKLSQIQGATVFGLVVAYVFQNLFVLDSMFSLLALFVLAGLVFGLFDPEAEEAPPKKITNRTAVAVILFVATIPIFFYSSYFPARKSTMFMTVVTQTLDKRPGQYKRLLGIHPIGDAWEVGLVADTSYKLYSENKALIKEDNKLLPYAVKDIEKLLEYLENIADKETKDYRLYIRMAGLYNSYIDFTGNKDPGLLKHVQDIEHRALELGPNDPQSYWVVAQTSATIKDYVSAQKYLERAVEIEPKIEFSNQLLVKFAKDLGDRELYKKVLENAKTSVPNFTELQ